MMRRAIAILAGLSIIAGCNFDLTEVGSAGDRMATLTVWLQSDRADESKLRVAFHPGSTDGRVLALDVDAITVNGNTVAPDQLQEDGTRIYTINAMHTATPVSLQTPIIPGIADPLPPLSFEIMRIVAPDTLIAPRTGTLEVRVEGVGLPSSYDDGWWSLDLHADSVTGIVLRTMGTRVPPPVLSVPVAVIPADVARGRLEVQMLTIQRIVSALSAYQIFIQQQIIASIPFRIED